MCGWFVEELSSSTGLDNCVAFATFLPLMSCVSSILFRELLTVRLLFIVSFNMKFSRYIVFGNFRYLMEMEGFEPLTPCLQGRCSPN